MMDEKPKRRTRKKLDVSALPYTPNQLRIKLQRYCKRKREVFDKVMTRHIPKSTTISMLEISMIAVLDRRPLFSFKAGKDVFSFGQLKRLCDALDLIESGRVVKTQAGKYTIHDEPQVAPVREMNLSLSTMKIMGGVSTPKTASKMPSFDKLFG
jgi:hypothetical protein